MSLSIFTQFIPVFPVGAAAQLFSSTGGGGCLVKNFGKVNADRVKFVDDICAAAKGYEYLAELQLGGKG